jgi:hypothetical protein
VRCLQSNQHHPDVERLYGGKAGSLIVTVH